MSRTLFILCLALFLSAAIVSGCETTEEGATSPPVTANAEPTATEPASPTEAPMVTPTDVSMQVSGPADARDAALAYIAEKYGDRAPAPWLTWSEENITPEGLIGSSTFRYTADGWVVTVSFPIVAPQATIFGVVAIHEAMGFEWQGGIDAAGQVEETSTPTDSTEKEPDPAFARDTALAYVRENYSGIAPATDLIWSEEVQNAPIGSSTIQYVSQPWGDEDSWVVIVTFPIGDPQATLYQVIAYSPATGFDLRVEVDAAGQVVEQEILLGASQGGQGINVSYSVEKIAAEVVRETIPGLESPAGWESAPEHVQLSLKGYIVPEAFHNPRILVYPVSEFEASSDIAASIIADLRRLLAEKPAKPEMIPFLPMFNAAQMMQAQMNYLDFQTGSGVRFLTQYGQDFFPINNHDMFYTFQGLTDDGQYYVAAILPVSHPGLPANGMEVPGGDRDAFANNYESYVADIEQLLNAEDLSSFTPNLSLLDAMIHSLEVSPPPGTSTD
jgi:hypothetical protein